MKLLLLISLFIFSLHGQNVLVINSNSNIIKYNEAVEEFSKTFPSPFKTLDITDKSSKEIKKALYDEYPDVVYAIGAKAYQYAHEYIPEKEIYFSSIIDWKRLPTASKQYGVSNELHSGMQLILIKTLFSDVKTIGVPYSHYTQNSLNDLITSAKEIGIEIKAIKVDDAFDPHSLNTLLQECDTIMIIADPLVVKNNSIIEYTFSSAKINKKPIIAYHELFIQYGAVLVISSDNPTIGRQIASMIVDPDKTDNIQYPAGTNIIVNKKEAKKIGINFSPDILSTATEIIE